MKTLVSIFEFAMEWVLFVASFCLPVIWASDNRIVGGAPEAAHSSPHVVHLDTTSLFCGGSLIDAEWVLTAAHCYLGYSAFNVVLGDYDLSKDEGTEQYILPAKVIPHPQYDSFTKEYDVMLVKLKEPAKLSQNIQPVPLAQAGVEPDEGDPCSICGWGNVQTAAYDYPNILRCVDLPVVSTSSCNDVTSYNGLIKETMFCIGDVTGGQDACDGDSGGPAVCKGVLTGVVSWGYGCAYPNFPGVYAKVSSLATWIETTMRYN